MVPKHAYARIRSEFEAEDIEGRLRRPKSTVGDGLRPPPNVDFQCILFKFAVDASIRVLWDRFEKVGATCVGSAKATFSWLFQRFRNVGATYFRVGATYSFGGI